MQTLLVFMNFLDFMFFPLAGLLILSIIVEQVIRRVEKWEPYVFPAMAARKFLWQQNILVNVVWFLCFFGLTIFAGRAPSEGMGDPNLLWKL